MNLAILQHIKIRTDILKHDLIYYMYVYGLYKDIYFMYK